MFNCINIRKLYIPNSVKHIEPHTFLNFDIENIDIYTDNLYIKEQLYQLYLSNPDASKPLMDCTDFFKHFYTGNVCIFVRQSYFERLKTYPDTNLGPRGAKTLNDFRMLFPDLVGMY